MHSHHSHSGQFCAHAKGTLEEVVSAAIARGFETFGLTEHVPRSRNDDMYPEEVALSYTPTKLSEQFDAFVAEACRLKALYASQISLLVGLETEYIGEHDLDELERLLREYSGKIDYVVGSVHHVGGVPIDFDRETWMECLETFRSRETTGDPILDKETMGRYFLAYFTAQGRLLERFRPAVVGHFDLCRMYIPETDFRQYPEAWRKIEQNVELVVGYGGFFEINAAAFRKGWNTAYPGPDIVELILEHGGRFCLSDDSHGPQAVGLNYHRIPEYLRNTGIASIWRLEATKDDENADETRLVDAGKGYGTGQRVRAVCVDGWEESQFWKQT